MELSGAAALLELTISKCDLAGGGKEIGADEMRSLDDLVDVIRLEGDTVM